MTAASSEDEETGDADIWSEAQAPGGKLLFCAGVISMVLFVLITGLVGAGGSGLPMVSNPTMRAVRTQATFGMHGLSRTAEATPIPPNHHLLRTQPVENGNVWRQNRQYTTSNVPDLYPPSRSRSDDWA